ncbi:hypothetical protein LIER_19128 [Lithospermum erythrorhizon]|uniref:SET domain-containing protein n=1 Tax=Lithospermum erythrorhizon TaxID=34254 RepID=A0AAV3QJA1_LITER
MEEETLQSLRAKANELLLREEWSDSIQAYSNFISLSQNFVHLNQDQEHLIKLKKSLSLAYSNRAEARFRLKEYWEALEDCDEALKIGGSDFKTLLCKGRIFMDLNMYSAALDCFKCGSFGPDASENAEMLEGCLKKCLKVEGISRTGVFDVSDWVVGGFCGNVPDLAEFIGPIEVKKSGISGRGLFAMKNIECGSVLLITKAVATERVILPQYQENGEDARLVMWKSFVDMVVECAKRCTITHDLISMLSNGENEDDLEIPQISEFKPETEKCNFRNNNFDMEKMLTILDVNSLVEDAISAKVFGKNSDYHGVGLWVLASLINHSCDPSVRRLHIGDHVIVHASKDVKAGEELTFAYYDVLTTLNKRREMAKSWGFYCNCNRCKYEEEVCPKQEMRELEMIIDRGVDMGVEVSKLEDSMRRWMVRGKGKGYLRASFWGAYSEVLLSEKLMRRWGRKIPTTEVVIDSIFDTVGSDGRLVRVAMEGLKKPGANKLMEMERAMKLGRGLYGKGIRKQAMRTLLQRWHS